MPLTSLSSDQFIPFTISIPDDGSGFRIGGKPPKEVTPNKIFPFTKYFLTIPMADGMEISIFYSFDYENDGEWNPFDMSHILFDGSRSKLIQAVPHRISQRGDGSDLESDLSGAAIEISNDIKRENPADIYPYPFHKIGGLPAFTHEYDTGISRKCREIMDDYHHLCQLSFESPPGDCVIKGNWPFGDSVFHFFLKKDENYFSYMYCWG